MPAPTHRAADEVATLAGLYSQPVIINATLRIRSMFGALDERPARVAEVVPVIQRPNGRVLTMTKSSYPAEAYRLPSGGIHKGEPILDALLRESYEETGLSVSVQRFLAVIRYQVIVASGRTGRFTSYAFLVQGDGPIQPKDENEHISGFREVALSELWNLAALLENMKPNGDSDWSDWGRYRAVVHRVVAGILASDKPAEAQMTGGERA
jgi:8-oxo-dGTP pyrophosphatase MutT (NUDIX family)